MHTPKFSPSPSQARIRVGEAETQHVPLPPMNLGVGLLAQGGHHWGSHLGTEGPKRYPRGAQRPPLSCNLLPPCAPPQPTGAHVFHPGQGKRVRPLALSSDKAKLRLLRDRVTAVLRGRYIGFPCPPPAPKESLSHHQHPHETGASVTAG